MPVRETLYKIDQAGNVRTWALEISDDGTQYRSLAGVQEGAIVESEWTQVVGNQQRPSAVDQCEFLVNARYTHQLSRTYHRTVEGARTGAHFFEPMLAEPLDRKRIDMPQAPGEHDCRTILYVQPKLDGMRCIVTASGMFSRQGKEIVSAPHIMRALIPWFAENPDSMLDGELYGDALSDNFQKIMSLARKSKPTAADLRESEAMLEYHVYDRPDLFDDGYTVRHDGIATMLEMTANQPFGARSPIKGVTTIGICSWDEWDSLHAKWCGEGYEGSIGRRPHADYQQRRTHDLIKRKDFDEAEFDVSAVGEGEGNWSGACKQVYCWLPIVEPALRVPENAMDPLYTFKATPMGSWTTLHGVLNGELPTSATVKYLGWTTTDIPKPRHGIAKHLWWGPRDV